jgi:hypothetical protein
VDFCYFPFPQLDAIAGDSSDVMYCRILGTFACVGIYNGFPIGEPNRDFDLAFSKGA